MKRMPLHRRTRTILASVSKEIGTEIPWADCFAEIAGLDEAVRKCFEPAELDALEILDAPVVVGAVDDTGKRWWQFWKPRKRPGTKFYAMTLNAEDWFEEFCEKFPDSPEMQTAAWLYASAHSMDPDALMRTWNDKFKLAWTVWLWRCRCGIKRGQIAPLQALLMPETPWPKGGDVSGDNEREGYAGFGWMVATLCRLKNDPDWWRNKVPFLKAMQCYRDATMYGETDKEVRSARWEQWKTASQSEEAVAIKRLKEAWKALGAQGAAKADGETPEGDDEPAEASPREESAIGAEAPESAEKDSQEA